MSQYCMLSVMRFDVLAMVNINIMVLSDVMQCSLVEAMTFQKIFLLPTTKAGCRIVVLSIMVHVYTLRNNKTTTKNLFR
jgi:hypothetical protein